MHMMKSNVCNEILAWRKYNITTYLINFFGEYTKFAIITFAVSKTSIQSAGSVPIVWAIDWAIRSGMARMSGVGRWRRINRTMSLIRIITWVCSPTCLCLYWCPSLGHEILQKKVQQNVIQQCGTIAPALAKNYRCKIGKPFTSGLNQSMAWLG